MGDQEMVGYLAHALQDPGGVAAVDRDAAARLRRPRTPSCTRTPTRSSRSPTTTARAETLADVYGKDVIPLAYRRPGFRISQDVADAIARASRGEGARPRAPRHDHVGRDRHGGVRGDDRADHARRGRHRASAAADARSSARRACACVEPAERRATALALAPRCAGSSAASARVIVTFDDVARRARLRRRRADAPALSQVGPATPDHTIYTKRLPCFVADADGDPAALAADVEARRRRVRRATTRATSRRTRSRAPSSLDPLPRVVLVPGLGMFTAGKDRRTAGIVERHLPPHHRRHRATRPRSAATCRSRRRTPSTSSTGRSSSTS